MLQDCYRWWQLAEWLAFTYAKNGVEVACLCLQVVRTQLTALGDGNGGPAGLDGMIEPVDAARDTTETLKVGSPLILRINKSISI